MRAPYRSVTPNWRTLFFGFTRQQRLIITYNSFSNFTEYYYFSRYKFERMSVAARLLREPRIYGTSFSDIHRTILHSNQSLASKTAGLGVAVAEPQKPHLMQH